MSGNGNRSGRSQAETMTKIADLRETGLQYPEIATNLGVSSRYVRQLCRRSVHVAAGLCIDCDETHLPDRLRCELHSTLTKSRSCKSRRTPHGRFLLSKEAASTRKLFWDIGEVAYLSLIGMPCGYCGLENNVVAGIGLDRLDNTRGYVLENVISCCTECNFARNDKFTPEEMKIIGATIRDVKLARVRSS